MRPVFKALAGVLASMTLAGGAQANIEFVFDYSRDGNGVMTNEMKALLEQAAGTIEASISDQLSAIAPQGDFAPSIFFTPPDTGTSSRAVDTIGANQIYVYVGGRAALGAPHLALSGAVRNATRPASVPANDPAFLAYRDELRSRGQPGAIASTPTDYSPWGGSLAFDSEASFYVDDDISTLESFEGQYDFYTVALRGLLGILGYGVGGAGTPVASYHANLDSENLTFVGANALAEYGEGVPVYYRYDEENDQEIIDVRFLDDSVVSTVNGAAQTALMTQTLNTGERRALTALDYAILRDIGWQAAPVPEPAEYAMFLAGLGVLAAVARRRGA